MSECAAVLLAAGKSRRLGFDKILTPIAGKPVVQYSLEVLRDTESVGVIVIVTRPDMMEPLGHIVDQLGIEKPVEMIEGGKERQDSVYAGLCHLKDQAKYVAIHDAARPLITVEMMDKVLAKAKEVGGAICGQPATDTLKRSSREDEIVETVERADIWTVQTPQIFTLELIRSAYEKIQKEGFSITDDASAVEAMGGKIALVDAGVWNLKITRQQDWEVIELWLNRSHGPQLRAYGHDICNKISPMVGYFPLLEKYGGKSEKFKNYLSKASEASGGLQEILSKFQELLRLVYPKADDNRNG